MRDQETPLLPVSVQPSLKRTENDVSVRFPAARSYANDQEDYWKMSAKAWDKKIPEKINLRCLPEVQIGNSGVREIATKLRQTPAVDVIRYDPDRDKAVTWRELRASHPSRDVASAAWDKLELATTDQKIRRHQEEKDHRGMPYKNEKRWYPAQNENVNFKQMCKHQKSVLPEDERPTKAESFERWESLGKKEEELSYDAEVGKIVKMSEMRARLVGLSNDAFEARFDALPLATIDQRVDRQENENRHDFRWDEASGTNLTFPEMRMQCEAKAGGRLSPTELFERWNKLGRAIQEPLPLQCAAGPAVPIAFRALLMTWLLFLMVPVPVYFVSYGADDSAGVNGTGFLWNLEHRFHIETQPLKGQAVYPTALVWTAVSPFLAYLLFLEWKILQYVIIPQVQVTGGFTTFGCHIGFYMWLPISFGMSLISHLDLVTNGIFLATTWKMYWCDFGPKVDCIWAETIKESVFSVIPVWWTPSHGVIHVTDVFMSAFTFRYLVVALWSFMFTQALYGLIGAVPLYRIYHWFIKGRPWLERKYEAKEKKWGWRPRGITDEVRWDSGRWWSKAQCTSRSGDVAQWWESATSGSHISTESYLSEVVDYNCKEFEHIEDFARGGDGRGTLYQTYYDETELSYSDHGTAVIALADSCRMYSLTSMQVEYSKKKVAYYLECKHELGPAFGITKRVLVTVGNKVLLSGIFQNGLQMNLQVTLYAMIRLLEKHGRIGTPLGFTGAIFHVNVQMLFSICIGLAVMMRNFYEALTLFKWVWGILGKGSMQEQKEFLNILKRKFGVLACALAAYGVITCYAFVKLGAVFYCPQSMFNLWGCAHITHNATQGQCPEVQS